MPKQAGCPGGSTLFSGLERAQVPTLINAVQAISSTVDLNKLVETLLVIALDYGGAQRGVLLLVRANDLQIEAEASQIGLLWQSSSAMSFQRRH